MAITKTKNINRSKIFSTLEKNDVIVLPPQDVIETIKMIEEPVMATVLDPWYNKGVGGFRPDYYIWLQKVMSEVAKKTDQIFLWGFPEIIYKFPDHLPEGFKLLSWLTWYYKNCPSVIRGWRTAQMTCLHIIKKDAKIYPEHFLNEKQLKLKKEGKLRYMPGPTSVIEVPLNIGFVGRAEQTGHPAQKPLQTIIPLIEMSTKEGDIVLDPMCGSGTTGEACKKLGRKAILCDQEEEYVAITEKRLGVKRLKL